MIFENQDGAFAVIGVAIMIAVGEPRTDLSQIVRPDWLTAQHTESLRTGRPAIHQYESHVASSNAKRNDRGPSVSRNPLFQIKARLERLRLRPNCT